MNCSLLWWFDNEHLFCSQSRFCAAYAYYGLRTFGTEEDCLAALNVSCPFEGDLPPCGEVSLQEVVSFINRWVAGEAGLGDVVDLINAYQLSQ